MYRFFALLKAFCGTGYPLHSRRYDPRTAANHHPVGVRDYDTDCLQDIVNAIPIQDYMRSPCKK